jgi:hypothetical protein
LKASSNIWQWYSVAWCRGVSVVAYGARAGVLPGNIVVLVAGMARVFSSVYILKMGLRKVAETVTSGTSVMA